MIQTNQIHCVVGGQFGSEAKGHVTAQLIKKLLTYNDGVINVRVGGSNAGHSAENYMDGSVIALRTIPMGAVVDPRVNLVIAAGSEIDPDVLYYEIELLETLGIPVRHRLLIDRNATIIEQRHIDAESSSDLNARTGSTNKGIGAARAARLMRQATIARDFEFEMELNGCVTDTAPLLNNTHQPVVIEGTQGYGLGLHTDNYPQTTSGDCRAIDLIAQTGMFPTAMRPIHVWLVVRTYPIRVAGNSGGLLNELSWDQLAEINPAIKPEYTTVTKKMRRVGEWDSQLVREAIAANGGNGSHMSICLMFADYIDDTISHLDRYADLDLPVLAKLAAYERDLGQQCAMYGTSPTTVIWTR